jgi:pimeloyl-ACP methyl ester carboxylesterase
MIVPYLQGYGTTRFLSNDTMRDGQQSALAVDTIALMDALHIESAIFARLGCPRGQRDRGAVAPTDAYAAKLSGKYVHGTVTNGVGHNLPQQAPQLFIEAIVQVDGFAP